MTGGEDAKRASGVKDEAAGRGGMVFAIPVKASGSIVKRPNIFSLPTLAKVDLPYNVLTKEWDETLTTLKLCAWEWKIFIEINQGPSWLLGLLNDGGNADAARERPSVEIPLPRIGRGGCNPKEFENKSV